VWFRLYHTTCAIHSSTRECFVRPGRWVAKALKRMLYHGHAITGTQDRGPYK
jgi:hypothetical protein